MAKMDFILHVKFTVHCNISCALNKIECHASTYVHTCTHTHTREINVFTFCTVWILSSVHFRSCFNVCAQCSKCWSIPRAFNDLRISLLLKRTPHFPAGYKFKLKLKPTQVRLKLSTRIFEMFKIADCDHSWDDFYVSRYNFIALLMKCSFQMKALKTRTIFVVGNDSSKFA